MKACSIAICIAVAVICSACDSVHQVAGTLSDLQQVQRTVSKALGADTVTVTLIQWPVSDHWSREHATQRFTLRSEEGEGSRSRGAWVSKLPINA